MALLAGAVLTGTFHSSLAAGGYGYDCYGYYGYGYSCSGGGGGGGGGGGTATTSTTAPQDQRTDLAGTDRIGTAIETSKDTFADNGTLSTAATTTFTKLQAKSVTLARADLYPDALSGTPFAVKSTAPLLLTFSDTLDSRVEAEIKRVIGSTGTVHLLGGTAALSTSVETRLRSLGYTVVRHAGADRYGTAVAIANALGNPSTIFEATGVNFPDALAAGAAAAKANAAVLLTNDSSQSPTTSSYIASHSGTTRYAIGGPASRADSSATAVAGLNRYDTAVKVAEKFFSGPTSVGLASGENFPDALSGGDHIGFRRGPLLLTPTSSLAPETKAYCQANKSTITVGYVYGGIAAIDTPTRNAFQTAYSA